MYRLTWGDRDVLSLTNAVTDIFFKVSEEELAELGLRKGFALGDKRAFYASPKFHELMAGRKKLIPGGSPANVSYGLATLGRKAGLMGTVGDDEVGRFYHDDVTKSGQENLLAVMPGTESGVCYIFVTPDGEKTQIADLRVSKQFNIDHDKLEGYKIFHTSGYELLSQPDAVKDAFSRAKNRGVKVSFDMADPAVPRKIRPSLEEALRKVDYLTVTEHELREYSQEDELEKAIKAVQGLYSTELIAVKKGAKGSELLVGKERTFIPTYPCMLVNTTGAGDTYMAGLLTGIILGWHPEDSARLGSYAASLVCSQQGGRLEKNKRR